MTENVTIRFKRDDEYRELPVSGIWGGITPQGDLFAELFTERRDTPDMVEMEIDEHGNANEVRRTGDEEYVRTVLVGLLMKPTLAYSIGEWLIEKAKLAGIEKVEH